MKIEEFIKEQQKLFLSDYEKFSLYDKILSSKGHTNHSRVLRYLPSIKQAAYFSILGFLLVGIYGTYFLNEVGTEEESGYGIVVHQGQDTVSAGYIAKVVEFTGDFHIEQHNDTIKTNTISNNDTVIVKNGTKISFDVVDGSRIEMIGPARFSIHKNVGSPYKLYIQEGFFTSIKNIQKNQNMEVVVKDKIMIKTDKEHTDFQIAKKGEKYFVNNKGHMLNISTSKTTKILQLQKNNVLTIRNNNDILTIQDKEQFAVAVATKDISQSFDLSTPTISDPKDSDKQTSTLKDTETQQSKESKNTSKNFIANIANNEGGITDKDSFLTHEDIIGAEDLNIDEDIINTFVDNKEVFTSEQHKYLEQTFNTFFLKGDSREILVYHLVGNNDKKNYLVGKVQNKIIKLGNELNVHLNEADNLSSIQDNLTAIKSTLEKKYYTPESYLTMINKFQTWIKIIQNNKFSSIQDLDSAEQKSKELIN